MNKVYLEYKDVNEYGETEVVRGLFEVIELTKDYVKFKTKSNIITIPMRRIEKIKERI